MNTVLSVIARILAGIGSLGEKIVNLWESEPVAVTGLITVSLDVAVAFGVNISPDQKTAVIGLVSAIGILIARQKVTPTAAPVLPKGTEVTVTTPGPTADKIVTV